MERMESDRLASVALGYIATSVDASGTTETCAGCVSGIVDENAHQNSDGMSGE